VTDDRTALIPATGNTALIQSLVALLPGVTPTATGLIIPNDLPYDDWLQGTQFVRHCLEANEIERNELLWAWVDLMRHGENHYGERAAQAAELGYATGTLYNVVWIGGVESSCRHEDYSFWSHAPVAMLPAEEQKYWLDKATTASPRWSRRKLTEEVERAKLKREGRDWDREKTQEAVEAAVDRLNDLPEEQATEIMEAVATKKAKTAGRQDDPVERARRALARALKPMLEVPIEKWAEVIVGAFIWPLGYGDLPEAEYDAFISQLETEIEKKWKK